MGGDANRQRVLGFVHDFNNQLMVMLNLAELLQTAPPPGEQWSRDLALLRATIERTSARAIEMVALLQGAENGGKAP